jgi:hypothetical protein
VGEGRPDVPASLVHLLFGLLAKDPDDRPEDAAVVARRLEAALVEVLAREPALELGPWLRAVLPEECEEASQKLEAGLADAVRAVGEQLTGVASHGAPGPDATPNEPSRRGTRLGMRVGAGAVLIFVAWFFSASFAADRSEDPLAPTQLADAPTAAPARAETPPVAERSPDAGARSVDASSLSTDDQNEMQVASATPEQQVVRRRAARRRQDRPRARPLAMESAPAEMASPMVAPALQLRSWGESE